MRIEVYGKQDCRLCESAKKKIEHFLGRWDVKDSVELAFMDIETESGAAEADFFDVFEIPTVLVLKNNGELLARWDGKAPPSRELQALVCPEARWAAA